MSLTPLRGGPAREAELLGAVIDVLRETGYDRLTVDAVAARARASKQTFYRRWPSKAKLVVAAVANAVPPAPAFQDTGSLRSDLITLLDGLRHQLTDLNQIMAGLIGELRRNPELATAMRDGFFDDRRRIAREVFNWAKARGELADDVDVDLLWQVPPAMMFFRAVFIGQPIDSELIRRLVDHIVVPLAQGSASAANVEPGSRPDVHPALQTRIGD